MSRRGFPSHTKFLRYMVQSPSTGAGITEIRSTFVWKTDLNMDKIVVIFIFVSSDYVHAYRDYTKGGGVGTPIFPSSGRRII